MFGLKLTADKDACGFRHWNIFLNSKFDQSQVFNFLKAHSVGFGNLLSSSATLSSAVRMNSAGFILTSWAFNHSIKVAPFYGLKVSCHEH